MENYNSEELLNKIFTDNNDSLNPYEPKNKKRSAPTKTLKKPNKSQSPEDMFSKLAASIMICRAEGREPNPFLHGFEFDVKKSNGDRLETETLFDENGNQIETRHNIIKLTDSDKFIKIYPDVLSKFFDLSNAGKCLLVVVFNEIQKNDGKDFIYLSYTEKYQFVKNNELRTIGKNSYYRGVEELIQFDIIARSSNKNIFFINPRHIFNGNRITFCQTFILRNSKLE